MLSPRLFYSKFAPRLGLLLMCGVFVYSAVQVFSHRRAESDATRITLRLGHWLLHAGMREAFDEAIAEYQALNPHVRIEQLPVPIRTYAAWTRTQLIGGNAPDLTGILTLNEELITRHFLPLSSHLDQPNPYNVGTPLEGVPWRETIVDGLAAARDFTPTAGEIHGVNLQINTLRLYYNRRLLHAVTGSPHPPADFASLLALAPQVADYNLRTKHRLVAVASCGPYAQYLFNTLVPSQTQRLALELSPSRNLTVPPVELAALFLRGEIDYHTPSLRRALELTREVTSIMPPGFIQLQRDDALFTFLQGNAVMFYAGSWDYAVLVRDADFETGIAQLPLPANDDPIYGPQSLGSLSEAAGSPEATLGIVRTSRNPEVALDFLHFLSSHRVAGRFSQRSHRISAVVEAEAPPEAPGLAPRLDGEVNGFGIDFINFGGGNAYNHFQRHLHTLIGPRGNVDTFISNLENDLPKALQRDLNHHLTRLHRDVQRLDSLVILQHLSPVDHPLAGQGDRLAEVQIQRQQDRLRLISSVKF